MTGRLRTEDCILGCHKEKGPEGSMVLSRRNQFQENQENSTEIRPMENS